MNYARLRELYDRVGALGASEREALLDAEAVDADTRAALAELLMNAQGDAGEDDPIARRVAGEAARAVAGALPERIGPWRILDLLGEGGMGVVLLGERADGAFEMRVAIKLITGLASPSMRERFRRERQVLAALDHPNIADLIDGGTTEAGEPYLVMPLVEGETLHEWLLRAEPPLEARLALFVQLCHAVHHAHQRLVVHRDLKPGNVMVRADGSPVLLDFGIAKLLDDTDVPAARTATRLMTPRYASPEQLLGLPVTTATDVHGLGLLLYELLAGSVPERGDLQRAASVELPPPSQHARGAELARVRAEAGRVRGDLDRIVRRAIRTDMSARYPSALALAEDVEAFLEGRPVQAAGRHRAYLLRRFVQRHRWGVAAGTAGLLALAASTLQWKDERDRALAAERQASRDAHAANGVTDFLVELFSELDPEAHPGRQLSARELLDLGRERLAAAELERPELRMRLQESLGWIYANAGQPLPAIGLLEEAVRAREAEGPSPELVRTRTTLARALNTARRHAEALPLAAAAAAAAEQLQPAEPKLLAHALMVRGVSEQSLADGAAAEASFARAQALFTALGARAELASVLHNRGWMAEGAGDDPQALHWYDAALAEKRAVFGDDHPKTLTSLHGRGKVLARLGRHEEARALFTDLLQRATRVHGPATQAVETAHAELASVSQDLGQYADASTHYAAALALARQLSGGKPSMGIAVNANNLASLLEERGDWAQAERLYRESLAMRRGLLPEGHPGIATPLHNLARLQLAQLDAAAAVATAREALALRAGALAADHPLRLRSALLLAEALAAAGERDAATQALAEAEARLAPAQLDDAALALQQQLARAALASASGDPAGHVAALESALAAQSRALAPSHPRSAIVQQRLAQARLAAGDRAAATALVSEAAPILRRALGTDAPILHQLQALEAALQ